MSRIKIDFSCTNILNAKVAEQRFQKSKLLQQAPVKLEIIPDYKNISIFKNSTFTISVEAEENLKKVLNLLLFMWTMYSDEHNIEELIHKLSYASEEEATTIAAYYCLMEKNIDKTLIVHMLYEAFVE